VDQSETLEDEEKVEGWSSETENCHLNDEGKNRGRRERGMAEGRKKNGSPKTKRLSAKAGEAP
jgi:hypothetical protein